MLFSKKYINFIIIIIILELYKNDIKFCVVFWKNYASRKKIQLWDRVNIGCDIWTLIVLKRTMLCPAGTNAWKKIPLPHLWQIGMKRLHLSRWRCCLATWEKGHSCKGSGCVVWRWAESISTWIIRWIYPSGRSPQEKNAFFRHCSNYLNLPPPVRVSPIRVTCTSFFRHRNSSFGSQFRTKNTTYIQPKNSLMLKLLAFWKK